MSSMIETSSLKKRHQWPRTADPRASNVTFAENVI